MLFPQEVIAQRSYVRQCLQDHVTVVVEFDVIQANDTRIVHGAVDGARRFYVRTVQLTDFFVAKCRIQQVLDVVQ